MAPKVAKELAPLAVKRLTDPGRHAVGGVRGLYLNVTDTGARQWVLRIKVGGRRLERGLGPYPEVGLAEARDKAREYRQALEQGRDLAAERKAARAEMLAAQARLLTFAQAAESTHKVKAQTFRNRKHAAQWLASVERYAYPVIGSMAVDAVQVADVLRVLQPIWADKPETATRLRQRLEAILAWATVAGHRSGDNPARWPENLDHLLGKPQKKVRHHPALPWQEVGRFMADLKQRKAEAARALELLILTAARSGEIRGMDWSEVNLEAKTWTIPAARIKAARRHSVPLSDSALAILRARPDRQGLVFRAQRGGQMSDRAFAAVIERMHASQLRAGAAGWIDPTKDGAVVVPHGFRSTFKDWARSCTRYPDEVSELQLAHVNSDQTRAAYARDELLPQRARIMAEWADFLSRPMAAGEVVGIGKRA